MILTFGRFKGLHIRDMPLWYLKALLKKDDGMRDYVRAEIEKEVKRKEEDKI
jgi:hypothetical protein